MHQRPPVVKNTPEVSSDATATVATRSIDRPMTVDVMTTLQRRNTPLHQRVCPSDTDNENPARV